MAGVAVTSLLEKLSRLGKSRALLIFGIIDKELEQLKRDLSILKGLLLEHDDVEEEDDYRPLIGSVKREIQVEDIIDASLTKIIENTYFSMLLFMRIDLKTLPSFSRIFLFREVKMIKKLLVRIINLRDQMIIMIGFPAEYSSKMKRQLKTMTTLPPIHIDNVMGRDGEEEAIISYLMESSEKHGIISIIGEPGVGKTTLARRIYVNTKIAYEFPVRIWINTNKELKLDDILGNILRVFTSQDIHSLSHEELSENVVACLEKKKFLLVLDNMRDLHTWKAILNVLSKSDVMGKVLITTKSSVSIGKHANLNMWLDPLGKMDSWKLLHLKVFGDLKRCPPELEDIGPTIAHKCRGLPLLIILVGGILMGQLMKSNIPNSIKDDVLEVYKNVNKDLGEGKHDVLNVVELAYGRLSDELRQCFLYMGVFPEHYEISAWTLTRLWIAEGFVRPMEGRHSLEEAAAQNLDDLIRMSLVMVDKINPFGKVKTCRVHGIISSFIREEAAEQGFFHLLSLDHFRYKHSRRLCVHSNANTDFLAMEPKISGVRSVLCFNESSTGLDPNGMSTILNSVHLLKVLDSKFIKFHKLPQQITKLFHLRYVTLFVDDLNTLPGPLSRLWNLETLVVDTESRVITMGANIWRLIWLRHLKTNAAIVLSSYNEDQSLAGGANLQTLTRLSPESCTTEVSARARNLKSLGIRGDLKILFDDKVFLERFNLLEKLKLIHDVFPMISSENPLPQLPPPNCFPPNLKWLTLSQTHLLWDRDMPTLANIKTLQVLKLKDDAFSGIIWRASGDCFPSLKLFLIENTDLVIWKASTKSLPRLSCLVLKNCENLREIPEAVAENLQRLEIEHLGKSAVDSARRIADRKQQAQEEENVDCPFKLYIGPGCYY